MPNILGDVLQSITVLLQTNEPQFVATGFRIFFSLSVIAVCWQGVEMMWSNEPLTDHMAVVARLMLMIAFGYAINLFYAQPIPGIGQSFSTLLSSQGLWAMKVLDNSVYDRMTADLSILTYKFSTPSLLSISQGVLYALMILIIAVAEAVITFEVVGPLIALAVCALMGPLFAPFFMLPKMEWLFWGWLKAMISFSFFPSVVFAVLLVCEGFLRHVIAGLPDTIPPALYVTFGFTTIVTVLTLLISVITLPAAVTAALFSGGVGHGGGIASRVVSKWL